jgi:hypothetical protein
MFVGELKSTIMVEKQGPRRWVPPESGVTLREFSASGNRAEAADAKIETGSFGIGHVLS